VAERIQSPFFSLFFFCRCRRASEFESSLGSPAVIVFDGGGGDNGTTGAVAVEAQLPVREEALYFCWWWSYAGYGPHVGSRTLRRENEAEFSWKWWVRGCLVVVVQSLFIRAKIPTHVH
jgi:hypothetical protein